MFEKMLDENSTVSCMRFMAVCALFFSFAITIYGIFSGKDVTVLAGMFLGAAFGGKLSQKFAEVKNGANDTKPV